MHFELPYGRSTRSFELPDGCRPTVLEPSAGPTPGLPSELVSQALAQPIASPPLGECLRGAVRIVVAISDITRPCPSHILLPPLLDTLNEAGIPDDQVTVVCAIGLHRHHTETERRALVGDAVWKRVSVVDSDPDDVVALGTTTAGTPVEITRLVAEADAVIAVGNIEYHYFAGYSGGYKAIVPGCSSFRTVSTNHSLMLRPGAVAGRLQGNPARLDLEEAGRMANVRFVLNAILDSGKEIVGMVAGDPLAAHRAGAEILDSSKRVRLARKVPISIASPGGYPKDINLYQAHKGMEMAAMTVVDGGTLILVAECEDGVGHDVLERWLREARAPSECVARLQKGFVLGGHKAAAIARLMLRTNEVDLVSSLPTGQVLDMGFVPCETVQAAVDHALAHHGEDSAIVVMPHAAATLPIIGR
jgi:nickel-dependent lactate racemase